MFTSEPMPKCRNCGASHTMEEGMRSGMRCLACGGPLTLFETSSKVGQNIPAVDHEPPVSIRPLSYSPSHEVGIGELSLPSHNEVDAQAIRQFFSSMSMPVSLEYYGAGSRRSMLVRAPIELLKFLAGKIAATWPAAQLTILSADPLNAPVDRSVSRYDLSFGLQKQAYFPLRSWKTFLQGDPVHGILASTLGLRENERAWIQVLVSRKGEPEWLPQVQRRLKAEMQKGFITTNEEMVMGTTIMAAPVEHANIKSGLLYLAFVIPLAITVILAFFNPLWVLAAILVVAAYFVVRLRFFNFKEDEWLASDMNALAEKVILQENYYLTMVRASVWAENEARARIIMDQIQSALSQFDVSGGNRFVPVRAYPDSRYWPAGTSDQSEPHWMWLTASEVSALWHPPIVNEQISPGLINVRGVESRAPDPADVVGYYQIGAFLRPDAAREAVNISEAAIRKNTFLIGKTGAGKSTLQEHLVLAALEDPDQPAVVVIDPHGDMVNRLLGAIPARHIERVRILDVGDSEFVLNYNPLDVKSSGLSPDQSAQLIIDIGRSLWSDFWGPRMQNPLKRGVQALAAANEGRAAGDALGLSLLGPILNAQHDVRKRFLDMELNGHTLYGLLSRFFYGDYRALSNSMREQIIQPVLSKAYRFEESPMLELFSTGDSMLNPAEIIQKRQILLVNTRMSKFGSELSDFVGSMLINVLIREISRQGEISKDGRAPVTMVIDEFQTFTGAPWQELVAQLRKWGGRTILGTQSLASMKTTSPDLVGVIMSGMYNLFAFQMNGEDARYIAENELSAKDGGPSASTLTNLEPYFAYARLVRPDGRLTRPFYFNAREPVPSDERQARQVHSLRANYSKPIDAARKEAGSRATYLDDQYGGVLLSSGAQPVQPGRRGRGASRGQDPNSLPGEILRSASQDHQGAGAGSAGALWYQLEALGEGGLGDEEIFGQPLFPGAPGASPSAGEADNESDDTTQATINAMRDAPVIPSTMELGDDPLSDFLASQFDDALDLGAAPDSGEED